MLACPGESSGRTICLFVSYIYFDFEPGVACIPDAGPFNVTISHSNIWCMGQSLVSKNRTHPGELMQKGFNSENVKAYSTVGRLEDTEPKRLRVQEQLPNPH